MQWSTLSEALADAVEAAAPSVLGVRGVGGGPISGIAWDDEHVVTVGRVGKHGDTAVRLPDGDVRAATVVGRARPLGLALLRVEGGGLAPARWAEVSPRVGHLVVALGRAHAEIHASLGMIARVGGPWRTRWGGHVDAFVAVDGAMPSGGSGGALVGHDGALLGMNTAGLVRGGTTVPHATVARVVSRMLGGGMRRAYLGASFIPVELPAPIAEAEGRPGALLAVAIEPGGPSAKAGVHLGDVLLGLAGTPVADLPSLLGWLGEHTPGEPVEARFLRAGAERTVTLTPTARPD